MNQGVYVKRFLVGLAVLASVCTAGLLPSVAHAATVNFNVRQTDQNGSVNISWYDSGYNANGSFIGVFRNHTQSDVSPTYKFYLGSTSYGGACSTTNSNGPGDQSGFCTWQLPSKSGYYEFRLFLGNHYVHTAVAPVVYNFVSMAPIKDMKTNDDDQLFYTYDGYGWYHPLNYQDSSAWPQNCDNGTGGWTYCNIPNDGTKVTYTCGSYGSVLDGSNDCLWRGLNPANLGAPWEGDTTTATSTSTITVECCAPLVELPNGDLFFLSGSVYIRIPGYWDAANDGFTQGCEFDKPSQWCYPDHTANGGWSPVATPAPTVAALPLPYGGDDIGCGCAPTTPPPPPPTSCPASTCPTYVELPTGEIYVYNSAEGGYDQISNLATGSDTGQFQAIVAVQPGIHYDPTQTDPCTGKIGLWVGVVCLQTLSAPVLGKKLPGQITGYLCHISTIGAVFSQRFPGLGNNWVDGVGTISCQGGTPWYTAFFTACIEKFNLSANGYGAYHLLACNGPPADGSDPFQSVLPFNVHYDCDFTHDTTEFLVSISGRVEDATGKESDIYAESLPLIVDGGRQPGGCY